MSNVSKEQIWQLFRCEEKAAVEIFENVTADPHSLAGRTIIDGHGCPDFDTWVGHSDVFMRREQTERGQR